MGGSISICGALWDVAIHIIVDNCMPIVYRNQKLRNQDTNFPLLCFSHLNRIRPDLLSIYF